MTDPEVPEVPQPGTAEQASPAAGAEGDAPAAVGGSPAADPAATEALRLADELEVELASLEAALRRVEEGAYGRCERCGAAIEDDVLAADPAATACRLHGSPAGG